MNADFLKELRDIHYSEPPGFWPPAWGYFVVSAIAILLIGLAVFVYLRYRKRWRLKRELLSELKKIEHRFLQCNDQARLQADADGLLRRLVFHVGKKDIGHSNNFDSLVPLLSKYFPDGTRTEEMVSLIVKQRYQKNPDIDGNLLISIMREQIKRCRI